VPVESFPEGVLDKSLEDVERNVNPGMPHVIHIIGPPLVYNVTVVVVVPAYWPSLVVPEPIAAVLEAVVPADHLGTAHVERVLVTEMGTVTGVRNAAIMAFAAVVSNGLSALWLRSLGALWLRSLGALWLCSLGALWLCSLVALWLCSLGALWLRFLGALWLCLLCALWLCLMLRGLSALRLRLVLRRLCFLSASALLLFALLCECRKGGSEKY